jgi:hypothetical protein
MANLIVTILAIALVAVMALAGLWYGSSGYNNSQAKARGAALISQAEQLGAGVRLWSTNNAGSVEAFGGLSGSASCVEVNDTTASSLISNGFLSTMPTVTSDVKDMGGSLTKIGFSPTRPQPLIPLIAHRAHLPIIGVTSSSF